MTSRRTSTDALRADAIAAQAFLDDAVTRHAKASDDRRPARFGIDLGTATIVVAAVDADGAPVYWDFVRAQVVRDGVVVDFHGAVQAVRELKARAEGVLGVVIDEAAAAHPPQVPVSDCRACGFVLQQAGIECRALTDEVSAANAVLGVRDGAVVDVGGGSTGVGVFRGGELAWVDDRPGGGHQLDLIVAGALKLPVEEAEALKREHGSDVMHLLRPGVERIGTSIRKLCRDEKPGVVHLAGGALQLPGAAHIVEEFLGWPVQAYRHAELITPFGIARS